MERLTDKEKYTLKNTFELTFGYSFNELCRISTVIRTIADKLEIQYNTDWSFMNDKNKTDL